MFDTLNKTLSLMEEKELDVINEQDIFNEDVDIFNEQLSEIDGLDIGVFNECDDLDDFNDDDEDDPCVDDDNCDDLSDEDIDGLLADDDEI
jgi:hypothetical protein